MTYLFIGAHVDDIELSCAGIILKLIDKGHHVKVISMSHVYNNENLETEFEASMNTLGVKTFRWYGVETRRFAANTHYIADSIHEQVNGYDFVVSHSLQDRHTDHRTVAEQVNRMSKAGLITFIAPWNGYQQDNYFIELSEEHLEKKLAALACYKSQSHRAYMNPEFIRSQAIYNGIKCGKKYAEAFRIERMIG